MVMAHATSHRVAVFGYPWYFTMNKRGMIEKGLKGGCIYLDSLIVALDIRTLSRGKENAL